MGLPRERLAPTGHHGSLPPPQSAVSTVTAAHDRQQLWAASVGLVVRLQARLRGVLARQRFAARSRFLRTWLPAVVRIQVAGSGRLRGAPHRLPLCRAGVGRSAGLRTRCSRAQVLGRARAGDAPLPPVAVPEQGGEMCSGRAGGGSGLREGQQASWARAVSFTSCPNRGTQQPKARESLARRAGFETGGRVAERGRS